MMRKNLHNVQQFDSMPSYLGRIFRISYYQSDNFPYGKVVNEYSLEQKNALFKACRDQFGMHSRPEKESLEENRQQYVRWRYSLN